MGIKNDIEQEGFSLVQLSNNSIVYDLKDILEKEANRLLEIETTDEYHRKLEELQKKVNIIGTRDKLIKELKEELIDFHGTDVFGAQTIVYLKGVRPIKNKFSAIKHEALPMHRENFYCDDEYINHQLNIHFPIFNYNKNTCMNYYPKSHKIPDAQLLIDKKDSIYSGVERFSKGHHLGLPYNPKIIQNFNGKKFSPAPCSEGQAFLFSSRLIHGGGENTSDQIRFSLDFATLPKKWMSKLKRNHFASYYKSSSHF